MYNNSEINIEPDNSMKNIGSDGSEKNIGPDSSEKNIEPDGTEKNIGPGGSIYGDERPMLEQTLHLLESRVETLREKYSADDSDPVEHCLGRIKSEQSMREKCRRKGLSETTESALQELHDAIGLRIVCAFVNDVYMMRDYMLSFEDVELVEEKDYIRRAKPNGYRSLHLIVRVQNKYYAEIQLRTISMDTWAALEHHMKYKKQVYGNTELLEAELKRCADELASTDLSMQTLRDMIRGDQSV